MIPTLNDRLRGQRALVTGGANGIGAAIARRLVAEGTSVTVYDRDAAAGQRMAAEINAGFRAMDLTDTAVVDAGMATDGAFDIVINNAGADQHAFFTDTAPADWQFLLSVNLQAALAVTRQALPAMQAAGHGRIVNIASEAGRQGSKGGAVYAAAKGGLIAFTKSLARENARYGITANVIAPGPVDTPMLRSAVAGGGEKLMSAMAGATLAGRLGQPDEIAAAVAFIASREAGFITGEVLGVSGGMGVASG